jgi:hypothetical protein
MAVRKPPYPGSPTSRSAYWHIPSIYPSNFILRSTFTALRSHPLPPRSKGPNVELQRSSRRRRIENTAPVTSTSPTLTGILNLFRTIIWRKLCAHCLPGGLRFRGLVLAWYDEQDLALVTELVTTCSDTLKPKCLDIGCAIFGTIGPVFRYISNLNCRLQMYLRHARPAPPTRQSSKMSWSNITADHWALSG